MADPSTKASKRTAFKVVIRCLPAEMSSEQLVKIFAGEDGSSKLSEENYWFCKPDSSLGRFRHSRAYVTFPLEQQATEFCHQYNGYVFVDEKGNESVANVEFAPYAMTPNTAKGKTAKEQDRRCNTIDEDSDFVQFLTDFNERLSDKKRVNLDELVRELEEGRGKAGRALNVKSTPLTEFLSRGGNSTKTRNASTKAERGNFKSEPSSASAAASKPSSSSSRREKREKRRREERKGVGEGEKGTNETAALGGVKTVTILKRDSAKQQDRAAASTDLKGGKDTTSSAGRERETQRAGGSAEKPTQERTRQLPNSGSARKDTTTRPAKRPDTSEAKSARRNKDRPERAIYQPSRVRRDGTGTTGDREKSADDPFPPTVKILRRGSAEKAGPPAQAPNSQKDSEHPDE